MKSKLYFSKITFLLFVTILFAACSHNSFSEAYFPSAFEQNISTDVLLYLVPDDYDPSDGIDVVIDNRSTFDFCYGQTFILEMQKENRWYQVPYVSSIFSEEGLVIPGGCQATHIFYVNHHFAELTQGIYRIILEGIFCDESGKLHNKQYLVVEFTITKNGQLQN